MLFLPGSWSVPVNTGWDGLLYWRLKGMVQWSPDFDHDSVLAGAKWAVGKIPRISLWAGGHYKRGSREPC